MSRQEQAGDSLGIFDCDGCGCNCGSQEMTVYNAQYMRCPNCACNMLRQDLRLKIRVYAFGLMNVKAMEALLGLVRALGVDESSALMQDSGGHYLEVPADGIHAHLEIARLTGSSQKKS